MCAGLYCLERAGLEADEVLATDSQVTMCSLNRHIRSPVLNVFNKHKALLDAMSACVLECARLRLHITIVKVESHVGIEGNEMADGLAKRNPTQPLKYPCHATVQRGSVAYQDICWPYHMSHGDTEDTSTSGQGVGRCMPAIISKVDIKKCRK